MTKRGRPGGVTVKDRGLKIIQQNIRRLGGLAVKVGVFSQQVYRSGATMTEVALYNEYGLGVPERSFLRSTVDVNGEKIGALVERAEAQVAKGRTTPHAALVPVGKALVRMVVRTIDDFVPPPNAQTTIDKKGFDHPLIETGAMRKGVEYRIGPKTEEAAAE